MAQLNGDVQPKPRVLNIRTKGEIDTTVSPLMDNNVYVGRGSMWGNPFRIDVDGTREEVIAWYEEWFMKQPELIIAAKEYLKGRDLICFCAPQACHGDFLLRIANE